MIITKDSEVDSSRKRKNSSVQGARGPWGGCGQKCCRIKKKTVPLKAGGNM